MSALSPFDQNMALSHLTNSNSCSWVKPLIPARVPSFKLLGYFPPMGHSVRWHMLCNINKIDLSPSKSHFHHTCTVTAPDHTHFVHAIAQGAGFPDLLCRGGAGQRWNSKLLVCLLYWSSNCWYRMCTFCHLAVISIGEYVIIVSPVPILWVTTSSLQHSTMHTASLYGPYLKSCWHLPACARLWWTIIIWCSCKCYS